MVKFSMADADKFRQGEAYVTGNGSTVRIKLPDGTDTALCTSTYCYCLPLEMKQAIAMQIAINWNSSR